MISCCFHFLRFSRCPYSTGSQRFHLASPKKLCTTSDALKLPRHKRMLKYVWHVKNPYTSWPLRSRSSRNLVCGHHFGWSLQTRSHFRGLSLSVHQQRETEVFVWLARLVSRKECSLHLHTPWNPPRRGLCKCLIWNDSEISQETAKSCNSASQFGF